MKISLKRVWISLILVAVLIPSLLLTGLLAHRIYVDQLNAALANERNANLTIGVKIDAEINRFRHLLKDESDHLSAWIGSDKSPINRVEINRQLQHIVQQSEIIHEVLVLSLDGEVIDLIDPEMGAIDLNEPSRSIRKAAVTIWQSGRADNHYPELIIPSVGREYVGSPDNHHGDKVLSIAVPIGRPAQAVLVGLLYVDKIWDSTGLTYHNRASSASHGYLVDRRGSLLNNVRDSQYQPGDLLTDRAIVRAGLVGGDWRQDQAYLGVNNTLVYGTASAISSLGWTLISEIPVSEVVAPAAVFMRNTLALSAIGIMLFLSVVLYLAAKTLTPIQEAIEANTHIARGDYDHHLQGSSILEFDRYAQGFNTMVDRRKAAEQALRTSERALARSEARFRGMLESIIDGVLFVDVEGKITLVNSAILQMSGYSKAELLGASVEKLVPHSVGAHHPQLRNQFFEQGRQLRKGDRMDLYLQRKDGGQLPVDIQITRVETDEGQFVSVLIQDISERKQAEEKILYQAHFDSLTGLPNRLHSLERLTHILADAKRSQQLAGVLFLDLDDFKKINDSLGHDVGDSLLIEAARRIQAAVRSSDVVGRLGGDEFIVLLNGIEQPADAGVVAENIINRFRDSFFVGSRELLVTVSVGVALFPGDGAEGRELLRNADSAMYHAKQSGRNTYAFFVEDMNRDVRARLAIEEQLHGALERDEFEVFYQPKLSLSDQRIVGAEALLRWHNKALGQVSPEQFIPIAEQTGLISSLGRQVLERALTQACQWRRVFGETFCMAVNLSPQQFRETDLIDFITATLARLQLPAHALELEITEGVLMGEQAFVVDSICALKKLGVKLAMDDFGTGYSSLSYLRNYPFDVVKIDRSFIRNIDSNEKERGLVASAIAMAHSLSLSVVAEGVETQAQHQLLQALNCDGGQGYLYGKPVAAREFIPLSEAGNDHA